MTTSIQTLKDGRVLEICEAQPEDAERVLAYVESVSNETSFLTFGPGELGMTRDQEAAFFQACQESPNEIYLLGRLDGTLVGSANIGASGRSRLRHRGELAMSVSRAFWRLGIGGALLDHLLSWARTNPILKKLDLRVRVDHAAAIALYRGRGFTEEGALRNQFVVDGEFFDLLAMGIDV